MRKLISLALILMLVLCLATTAFAASEPQPMVEGRNVIQIAAGESTFVEVDATAGDVKMTVVSTGSYDWHIVGRFGPIGPNMMGEAEQVIGGGSKVVIEIANDNAEEEVWLMVFVEAMLPGTQSNPAELVVGEYNTAVIEAGNAEGFWFTWTAVDSGELIVTLPEGDWIYVINNLTAGVYGDTQWSDSDPVQAIAYVPVNAGDLVQIMVSTYDPADMWNIPAGEIEIGTSFLCAHVHAEHTPATPATCHSNGYLEHWYCPDCDKFFADAAFTQLTNGLNVILPATGAENVEYIAPVEAGCHSLGNIAHYVCGGCNGLFEDEACTIEILPASRVTLPAVGSENIVHVDAVAPECHVPGMAEHWYCTDCGGYFTDAEATHQTNYRYLLIPAENDLFYFEEVEAGCHSLGNIEHWYCPACEGYYLDAFGTLRTNSLSVILPATGSENVTYVEEAEPYCHVNGMQEHWYCADCGGYFTDAECTEQTFFWFLVIPSEITMEYHEYESQTCVNDGMMEYWYCAECDCYFTDYEGKMNIARLSLTLEADGVSHILEYHEANDPVCHRNGNVEYWYCAECDCYFTEVEGNLVNTNAKNVVIPAENALEHHEEVKATCVDDGMMEYWYCAACDCYFTDAEGIFNIARKSLTIEAIGTDHNLKHYDANDPYCHRAGNVEYWYCDKCDCYFTEVEGNLVNTNAKNVVIPAEEALEYHEAVAPTCVEDGMMEYWYCAKCDCYFTDAQGIFNIARKRLVIEADGTDHVLEHHEANDPVCHKNGNVEYWYCAECDCYFIDVEGNLVNSNAKNVVILAEATLTHSKKVDATCDKDGMMEYWYCEECDCYFTDAEGKYNIARLSLTIPAYGHNYVDGKCDCGAVENDNPATGDVSIVLPILAVLMSSAATVAMLKKKEF